MEAGVASSCRRSAPLLHSVLLSSAVSDSPPGGPEQNKASGLARRRRITLCVAIAPPPGKHEERLESLDLNTKTDWDREEV